MTKRPLRQRIQLLTYNFIVQSLKTVEVVNLNTNAFQYKYIILTVILILAVTLIRSFISFVIILPIIIFFIPVQESILIEELFLRD